MSGATTVDLSAIKTDATSYAASFRTLIGVSTLTDTAIIAALGFTPDHVTSASSPLIRTANAFSIQQASGSQNGYISSTDWTTFNGKQAALGYTPANKAGDTFTGPVVSQATSGVPLTINAYEGGFTTQNVYVNSYGTLVSTLINQAANAGYAALVVGDTYGRISLGADSGTPFLGFGPGSSSRDVFFRRYATGPALEFRAAGGLRVRNADDTGDAAISAAAATFTGKLTVTAALFCCGIYTVGTLPSASTNAGCSAQVTDSSVAASGNYGATVANGGANRVQVFSDGTNWVIA